MRGFQNLRTVLALVAAVMLTLSGIGLSWWFERNYEQQKKEEISAQAQIIAVTSTTPPAFSDREAADEYVSALAANPEVKTAAIYDAKGMLLAGFSRVADQNPPQRLPIAETAGSTETGLSILVPVRRGSASLGTVYLTTFPNPLRRRLVRYGFIALFS